MAKFRIDDVVVDTSVATAQWEENTDWNGNNHISRATGSQWEHETLYRSRRGRFYIVSNSQWQGSLPSAAFVTDSDAAQWILQMDRELPDCLAEIAEQFSE